MTKNGPVQDVQTALFIVRQFPSCCDMLAEDGCVGRIGRLEAPMKALRDA